MGCGLSTRLNPEDAATLSHGHMGDDQITDINSSSTSKNLNQGKDVGEGEEEESYHSEVLIFPRSPSFRVYCTSNPMNQSFSHNDSAFSNKDNGDGDSTNKPEGNKERKKKERRTLGIRNAMLMHKGMLRRKKNEKTVQGT